MDALEELRQMHVEAKAAFRGIEQAPATKRGSLWDALQPELELHERIEERYVYDPVAADAGQRDQVLAHWESEHEEQVAEADAVMARIDAADPAADAWLQEVTALHATLETHIQHEEDDIWPRIRQAWDAAKLEEAGRAIAAAKAAAKAGSSVDDAVEAGSSEIATA